MQDLQPTDPYFYQWKTYQRVWRRSLLFTLLFFWGGGLLSVALVEILWSGAPGWVLPASDAPWVIAAIVASQAPIRWPCPRCSKPFHQTSWFYNGFARRCVHCALPKWSPRP
jgi:hypothetical protein